MEKMLHMGLLYDYYGELLTDKQRMALEYYYFDDYSLAEIAEHMGSSRQAVSDLLKRTEQRLEEYEERLGILRRMDRMESGIKKVDQQLALLEDQEKITLQDIEKIRKSVHAILHRDRK